MDYLAEYAAALRRREDAADARSRWVREGLAAHRHSVITNSMHALLRLITTSHTRTSDASWQAVLVLVNDTTRSLALVEALFSDPVYPPPGAPGAPGADIVIDEEEDDDEEDDDEGPVVSYLSFLF